MVVQWYGVDEQGVVAEVESFDAPLPASFQPYPSLVLEYALHCQPTLQRRLYRYREMSASDDRIHLREQVPDAPLTLRELVDACATARAAVRCVNVTFELCDAFIPEEIIEEPPHQSRDSTIRSKQEVSQADVG